MKLTAALNNLAEGTRTASVSITSLLAGARFSVDLRQMSNYLVNFSLSTTEPVVEFDGDGDELTITVTTNVSDWQVDWQVESIQNWLIVERTGTSVVVSAEKNHSGSERAALLLFTSENFPAINTSIEITQDIGTPAVVIFEDDFSWLGIETATLPASPVNLGSTSGERAFNSWAADFGAHGWTSTPTVNGSNNAPWHYSRYQYVKYGRGGNSADLITPKLANIVGVQDIIVSFKLNAYVGSAGNEITDFTIKVTGGGTITEILKVGKHTVTGVPCHGVVTQQGAHFIACNDWEDGSALNWDPDYSERSFVVTGATSETQIHFIGDGTYQARQIAGNRRFGFDDVLIILK